LNDKFGAEPVYLIPIVLSLLFGVVCAFVLLKSSFELYPVTPFPESPLGSFGNGLYFVVLSGIGASLVYLFLRRKKLRLISVIIGLAMTAAAFLLSLVYLYAILSRVYLPFEDVLVTVLAMLITVFFDFAVFRRGGRIHGVALMLLGGALGAFLGMSIPAFSAVLVLSFLAVYDVFAVYHGPVGKIAHKGLEQFRGLSFSFRDVQMGLGDLTFYSMLCGHMLLFFGVWACLASIVGVLVGCVFAFRMLERKGMFPGLPFPIFLGLALGLLVWLL
jgi:presenilin-like A22 family membrane protease